MANFDAAWPYGDGETVRRIRTLDWAATPLGPIDGWSERLKVTVEQLLASPLVSSLVCGPECLLIYNEAAARLYGALHPAALGRPLRETFPDGWATVAAFYERAFAGETVQVAGQPLDTRGEGGPTEVFDALLTPVRESDGRVAYVHMTGLDVGDRARMEAALRVSEARFRSLFEMIRQGYVACEIVRDGQGRAVDYRVLEANAQYERLTGIPLAEALGRSVRELVPDLEPSWIETFDRIVTSGLPDAFEHPATGLGQWFEIQAFPRGGDRFDLLYDNITGRKHAEAALRESEERQAFLLGLSDALRPLRDPREMRAVACRILGEHVSASRVYYVEYRPDHGYGLVADDYRAPGLPGLAGGYSFDAFRSTYERLGEGRTWIVADVATDRDLPEDARAFFAAQGVVAWVDVPLAKAGVLEAALCVVQTRPRDWSRSDIAVVEETAERLWAAIQRGHSETELRESEERFRGLVEGFGQFCWEASAGGLIEVDSPAWRAFTGQRVDEWLGRGWVTAIHPEDRAVTEAKWLRAVAKRTAVDHEYRLWHAPSGAWRWSNVRAVPITNPDGTIRKWAGVNIDVTEHHRLLTRQEVLIKELQHRTRNLLGVVAAVAGRTLPDDSSVAAFKDRLQALSRAQRLLSQFGSDTVEVGALVRAELAAHVDRASDRVTITGPEWHLTAQQVQNFALAVHELTTNAVKHGALKTDGGRLSVTWEIVGDPSERRRLALRWIESGVPVRPEGITRRGYGTELIQQALAYALEAHVDYALDRDGVRCRIEMPVSRRE